MSEVLIPRVLWAQRKDVVYLTIEVFEVKEEKIEINENIINFSGVRGGDDAKFAVKMELFGNVDADKCKISVGHREIVLVLAKSESGPFWPRLLKSTQKMHFIHTDFGKWVDEDDEEEDEQAMPGMGNFDMSQFAAGGNNFDGNEEFEEDEEEVTGEEEHECEDEQCSHSESDNSSVKISGLTKNNNFLPDSVNKSSGALSVAESGEVNLNFSGNRSCKTNANDHFYSGNQSAAKDHEFVLIVDHKNKTAKIQKVNHTISLRNVRRSRRLSSGNDSAASPVPTNQKRFLEASNDDDEIESLNSELFNDFI